MSENQTAAAVSQKPAGNYGRRVVRRLVAWNLMTLDGYFEGDTKWNLEFHYAAWGDELERFSLEQAQEIGTLLFGRVTYEGMAAHWRSADGDIADFMNGVEKVVVTRTLKQASWANSRILSGDLQSGVANLKKQAGKDVYVFGSAELLGDLLELELVDEYRICLAPILLGSGSPLFKPGKIGRNLALIDTRKLRNGAMILSYELSSNAPPTR